MRLLFFALTLTACGHSVSPTISETAGGSDHAASAETTTSPCSDGDSFDGHVTVTGVLKRTKGAQWMLTDMMVRELTVATNGGDGEVQAGQEITLEGDRCLYKCDPREQCLVGGIIPYLANIKVIP